MNSINKEQSNNVAICKVITDFIMNLHDCYGNHKNKHTHALNLYNRLITKLSLKDDDSLIERHVNSFRIFCSANKEQIFNKDIELTEKYIRFTDKIYINMEYIFSKADEDDIPVIFEYLMTIYTYLYPEGDAVNKLKKFHDQLGTEPKNVIQDIMKDLSSKISEDDIGDNPAEFISNFIKSDDFSEIVDKIGNTLSSSKMDMGNMMSMLQGVMGSNFDMTSLLSGNNMEGIMQMMNNMDPSLLEQFGQLTPPDSHENSDPALD